MYIYIYIYIYTYIYIHHVYMDVASATGIGPVSFLYKQFAPE